MDDHATHAWRASRPPGLSGIWRYATTDMAGVPTARAKERRADRWVGVQGTINQRQRRQLRKTSGSTVHSKRRNMRAQDKGANAHRYWWRFVYSVPIVSQAVGSCVDCFFQSEGHCQLDDAIPNYA